ncbi:MAG: hypothetical protein AB7Q97_02925 [Gammaproteobacteria bacterium]
MTTARIIPPHQVRGVGEGEIPHSNLSLPRKTERFPWRACGLLLAVSGILAHVSARVDTLTSLVLQPFYDIVDPQLTELGRVTDPAELRSLATHNIASKPKFKVAGYPVLSLETQGPTPSSDVIFFYHWWNVDGGASVILDSYHMLRAAPYSPVESLPSYSDFFAGVPNREADDSVSLFVQPVGHAGLGTGQIAGFSRLTLFGQRTHRTSLERFAKTHKKIKNPGGDATAYRVRFPDLAGTGPRPDIASEGVSFRVWDVAAIYVLKSDHQIQTITTRTILQLGSLHPQSVVYRTRRGTYRSLSFTHADLVKIAFDPMRGTADFEVYSYEFRERSMRVSTPVPDEKGRRYHPNLGIVSALPRTALLITHSVSSVLVAPLWQPHGFLASLAITEHADYVGVAQDIETMYGGDAPVLQAGRGFLGNQIPLTKTVFAFGKNIAFESRTASSEQAGPFTQNRLASSNDFLEQLRRYRSQGFSVEIGAHCTGLSDEQDPEHVVRQSLERLLEFSAVTWVDHGGPDCLWQGGWNRSSTIYIVPLLRKFGYKYFNALHDKYAADTNMIRENYPSNLLFYSVGLDDDLNDDWRPIVFSTTPIGFPKDRFTAKHVSEIVAARGFLNLHTYLPFEALHFEKGDDGTTKWKLNEWYNEHLANIAAANQAGLLYLATTRDLNDYVMRARNVNYYADGNRIFVENRNGSVMEGFGVAIQDVSALNRSKFQRPDIVGVSVKGSRRFDNLHYAWFDLPTHRAN